MEKIYTVIGNASGKANKLEEKLIDFLYSDAFLSTVKVGDSLSEKKLRNQFAQWNKEKLTVNVSSIINAKNLLKVARLMAKDVVDNMVSLDCIPVVHINKAHGNCSMDFVSVNDYELYYSTTEKKATKKTTDVFKFLNDYLAKDSTLDAINSMDISGKNVAIDHLIEVLEGLKN